MATLTDAERQALEKHTLLVEDYRRRLKAWNAELYDAAPSVRGRGLMDQLLKNGHGGTVLEDYAQAGAERDALDKAWRAKNPEPTPNDTPALIAKDIDEGMGWRRADPHKPGAPYHYPGVYHETEEARAQRFFTQSRGRISAFAMLVPSIPNDSRLSLECVTWVLGLQNLRMWCDDAMRPAEPLAITQSGEPTDNFRAAENLLTPGEQADIYFGSVDDKRLNPTKRLQKVLKVRNEAEKKGLVKVFRRGRESHVPEAEWRDLVRMLKVMTEKHGDVAEATKRLLKPINGLSERLCWCEDCSDTIRSNDEPPTCPHDRRHEVRPLPRKSGKK